MRAAGCGLAVLAAACVRPPGEPGSAPEGPDGGTRMVPRDLSGPPVEGSAVDPPAVPWPDEVPQRPAIRVEPVDPDPERILDQGPQTVRSVLGPPTRVRSEPPARIWQYVSRRCVLDVFLYKADGGDGERRAVYLDARDRQAKPLETRTCLRSLLSQQAAPGT
ncbi:hypothetical protein [Limimonas halophila]|nr:hypothetical protein [Limimonas halophila]